MARHSVASDTEPCWVTAAQPLPLLGPLPLLQAIAAAAGHCHCCRMLPLLLPPPLPLLVPLPLQQATAGCYCRP